MLPCFLAHPAFAGVYVEGDPTDWVTINAAVAAAPVGGTVLVDPGSYDDQLVLSRSVSIVGVGGSAVTTIHGGPYGPVVDLQPQTSATLRGLTFTSDRGVAVQATAAARLVLDDVVVADLFTDAVDIAAISFEGEQLVIHGSSFVRNNNAAGTIFARGMGGMAVPLSVLIDGATFEDNASSAKGCDLSTELGDQVSIVASRFVGGACHYRVDIGLESVFAPSPDLRLLDSTFEGGGDGIGAVDVGGDTLASTVTLIGNRFLDNQADFVVGVTGATVTSSGDVMSGGRGAFLYLDASPAEVVGGSFCGLGLFGSLLTGQSFLDVSVRNSVFASGEHGFPSLDLGPATLENATITGTITGLSASGTATNALYVGNGTAIDAPITDRYGMFWGNGVDAANGAILEDPVFADPGFPAFVDCATLDVALPTGSPAIDAGDPAIVDPDGTRSDIGATGGPGAVGWLDLDGDGAVGFVDCDDADATVAFGMAEVCNGKDDDCDGWIDDADPSIDRAILSVWWADADGDGYGWSADSVIACAAPDGYVLAGLADCDDLANGVRPEADELCNSFDDDCDGVADEDPVDAVTWYVDADGDGAGDPASAQLGCPPEGAVLDGGDCDDTDPERAADCGQPTPPTAGDDDDGDDDDTKDPDSADGGGCGCATGGSLPVGAALTALAVAFARRRRVNARV